MEKELLLTQLNPNDLNEMIANGIKQHLPEIIEEHFRLKYKDVDEILSRKEVAELLRISYVTLHKKMKEGLPYKRAGRRVLFSKKEILDWIDQERRIWK